MKNDPKLILICNFCTSNILKSTVKDMYTYQRTLNIRPKESQPTGSFTCRLNR